MFALCCLGFSLGSRLRFELLDLRSNPGEIRIIETDKTGSSGRKDLSDHTWYQLNRLLGFLT